MFAHQKYKKKQGKAIKTKTRTYILQQVSNISKRQCLSTRNIKKRVKQLRLEHAHTFYNKCPTYLKGNVTSTRNIKNRVKQLRLEHVHKLYNKCPTYLKGSVRPPKI